MSGSGERQVAARLLIRVEGGAFSSRLLGSGAGPGVRQRVLGVLRWQRALDTVLARHCRRSLDRLDPGVRVALRVGLFEATLLGVPPAVATDGAVHLVRQLGLGSAAGMVNAVLRRAEPDWDPVLAASPPDQRLSHPEWLFRRWADRLGEETAVEAMRADQEPAETWVWFFADQAREALGAAGLPLVPHPWCPTAWSAPGRARELLVAVERGDAYVQDPASQLVAHVAAALTGPDGGRLADLCAAPGGKLALLLALRRWRRAVGVDLRLGRARLVGVPVNGAGGGAAVVCADSTRPPLAPRSMDLVVVDAPCSGTGTLRRHPELRWRLEPEVLPELARTQARLVRSGLELVAPGGALLYATCSLEPEENEGVVSDLPPGCVRLPLDQVLPRGTPWLPTDLAGARLLPGPSNDGFTLHAVRRLQSGR